MRAIRHAADVVILCCQPDDLMVVTSQQFSLLFDHAVLSAGLLVAVVDLEDPHRSLLDCLGLPRRALRWVTAWVTALSKPSAMFE